MQFLFPLFLVALASIAIPILIHLFYFKRYKKIYFSNVSFLKSVQKTTQSTRKLREILILLARSFAVIFLVLAFAQPFFEVRGKVKTGAKRSVIYIDNSFSMGLSGEGASLLENAKLNAHEILDALKADDKVKIITNDKDISSSDWMFKDEAISRLNDIQISPVTLPLSKVYAAAKREFDQSNAVKKEIYLLSDFQRSTSDVNSFSDTSIFVNLLPVVAAARSNVYVDTCYFAEPIQASGVAGSLVYTIVNSGNAEARPRPVLKVNNNPKPLPSLSLEPGERKSDTVQLSAVKSGWQSAIVSVSDAPIQFDDDYYMCWYVPDKNNVLVLNDNSTNSFLNLALNSSGRFNVNNLEYNQFSEKLMDQNQLIILNGLKNPGRPLLDAVVNYLQKGGNLFIFPSATGSGLLALSDLLQLDISISPTKITREAGSVNIYDETFKNVFKGKLTDIKLPVTTLNFPINSKSARGAVPLINYKDGSPYLVRYSRQAGNVYLCSAPLDLAYNNLVRNGEVLVPVLFKAAFASLSKQSQGLTIGRNQTFQIPYVNNEQDAILKFTGPQTFVPEQINRNKLITINTGKENIKPGVYDLNARTGKLMGKYAFNYDRKESEMDFLPMSSLKNLTSEHVKLLEPKSQSLLASIVREQDEGWVLWRLCLIIALFFLLIEVLLIRFLK